MHTSFYFFTTPIFGVHLVGSRPSSVVYNLHVYTVAFRICRTVSVHLMGKSLALHIAISNTKLTVKNESLFTCTSHTGAIVQNFICLTSSLRPQLHKQIHYYFLLINVRILCMAKDSHILSTKNNSVFVIFMFEILTNR